MAQDGLVHTPLKFEDKIHVRDLLVQAVIGVNDNERVKNQNMIINLTLWANFDAVSESDHINDTLNYSWVAKSIEKLVVETKAGTLEYLAVKIAKFLLEKTNNIPRVAVSIAKPTAIGLAKAAEVHIERSKEISAPYQRKGAPYVLE